MVASFCRSRGLALGLTQAGIGVAVALIPPLIAIVIARQGRRSGFLALATIAALGLLTAQVALPRDRAEPRAEPVEGTGGDPELALEVIRRSPAYRLQLVAFSAMALAFAGMLAHFMPMLRDAGMPLERAGALAGLIGRSVIVTRILVGRLADLVEPAWLAAVGCAVCATGCLLLALGGTVLAPLAAIALGAAMGTEADLIGNLPARNFPWEAYSRAYARQYAAFMIAGRVSPLSSAVWPTHRETIGWRFTSARPPCWCPSPCLRASRRCRPYKRSNGPGRLQERKRQANELAHQKSWLRAALM